MAKNMVDESVLSASIDEAVISSVLPASMDESVLSASVQVSLRRMASREVVDLVCRNKLSIVLDELKRVLLRVSKVRNEAEIKQFRSDGLLALLSFVDNEIYEAEDLVFEIYTEALRRKMKVEEKSATGSSSIFSRVRNFFSSASQVAGNFKFRGIKARIAGLVHHIEMLLEQIMFEMDIRHLQPDDVISTSQRSSETGTLVVEEESYICGRDADRQAIIDLLLSDKDCPKISVIPIVGRPGIGKTALAELVYMDIDNMVNKPFDVKAWITVGPEFDVFRIAERIYETVANSPNLFIEETSDQLLVKLEESLEGKKCLLVLDNVSSEHIEFVYLVKGLFESALYGSKIIVTTRSIESGKFMGDFPYSYRDVQPLSEENSWRLFSKHVFNNVDPRASQSLEEIGRQFLRKCEGNPLAVKLYAGLLRTELRPMKWKHVLNIEDGYRFSEDRCVEAVQLSYLFLPDRLKQCFEYSLLFPYDYRFKKEKLILLWMAQDLLPSPNNKTLEEVGEEYFNDLASRSLFCKSIFGDFTMHYLVHSTIKEFRPMSNDSSSPYCLIKTRHLSWMEPCTFEIPNTHSMRTLMQVDQWPPMNGKLCMQPEQLQKLKHLRVLSLSGVEGIKSFLDSIGKLKLLRYLDLSWTEINEIPNTICSLYNLQTLLLQYCNISHLPNTIGNMKHLRHLDLSSTQVEEIPDALCNLLDLRTLLLGSCRKLTCLPRYMARLINLRHLDIRATSLREIPPQLTNWRYLEILSDFVVGTSNGSGVKMLGQVQNMHGSLSIRSLEKVVNVDDVVKANLKDEKYITDLSLEWESDTEDSQKAWEVLNRLQPHINLERISIINYGGINFSDWIADRSFSRLVYMLLSKCQKCHHLPPLGQLPSLKSLSIDGFDMVERIGEEFYVSGSSTVTKSFESLEKLTFKFMPRWNEWLLVEGEVFSQLKELHLMDCPSLTLNGASFPDSLPSLTNLYISKCQGQVVVSLLNGQFPLLSSLYIGYCHELKTFPERKLPTNIHTIEICGWENLESVSEEGWPSSLKSLSIGSCRKLFAPGMQWNLQTPTSLTSLDLSCIDEVLDPFPEEGKLPTTLTSLKLCRLNNLKSLNGKAFQQLTSLEELSISYCKELQCMPKEGLPPNLTSLHLSCLDNLKSLNGKAFAQLSFLEKLSISYCPQLRCIPEEGLPDSLSQLTIEWCRFLIPRCQREIGADWPKIAHIPSICTDPN